MIAIVVSAGHAITICHTHHTVIRISVVTTVNGQAINPVVCYFTISRVKNTSYVTFYFTHMAKVRFVRSMKPSFHNNALSWLYREICKTGWTLTATPVCAQSDRRYGTAWSRFATERFSERFKNLSLR